MKRTGYRIHYVQLAKIAALWKKGCELSARMLIRKEAATFGIKSGKIDVDLVTGEIIIP